MLEQRYWLLRLVLPGRWGRWLTGALIFGTLLATFSIVRNPFSEDAIDDISAGTVIFFCIILGYIVPIHHLIIERSCLALGQLEDLLDAGQEQYSRWQRRIVHKSSRWNAITLSIGLLSGCAHNALLLGGVTPSYIFSSYFLPFITTVLVWLIMTCVISSLIDNALLFRDLARRININLLNPRSLTPFGSVAVSSTLAMIGAQAAFPAMMLETDVAYVTYVPGLIATGAPMIFMFLLPVWPVHRRIVTAKRSELDRVSEEIIDQTQATPDDQRAYVLLNPLLTYRREITTVPEWPFDTSVIGRLAVYLIIPPLTWIGAAMIENLIDSAL